MFGFLDHIGWDFTDGMWLGAPSGLLAKDNREKPAYKTLEKLIHGEWHTSCELRTDENGCAEAAGFKGWYALSDGDLQGTFHLTGEGPVSVTLGEKMR
jgi:hypothetical protein